MFNILESGYIKPESNFKITLLLAVVICVGFSSSLTHLLIIPRNHPATEIHSSVSLALSSNDPPWNKQSTKS